MSGFFRSISAQITALTARLASSASNTVGSALIGYDALRSYAVRTVGWALTLGQPQTNVWYYLSDAQRLNLLLATPTLSSDAAIASAWAVVKATGGKMIIPPGNYLLTDQALWNRDQPKPIEVHAHGATFFAAPTVTGEAVKITGGYNFFGLKVAGLSFNHRFNGTVLGCFRVEGSSRVWLEDCHAEKAGNVANWRFAYFGTSGIPGGAPGGVTVDDYNCYWCGVHHCSTRLRFGVDGSPSGFGLILQGATNAFSATFNNFSDLAVGLNVLAEPATKTLPNTVLIERNFFESISTIAIKIEGLGGALGYGPTGWVVGANRVENCPTFVSITTDGPNMLAASQPVILRDNYCTTGSVTNWLINPTNYAVSTQETRTPGFGPAVANRLYVAGPMTIAFSNGGGLELVDGSGSSSYQTAYLKMGYTIWVSTSTSKLKFSGTTPGSDGAGTIIGPP